MRAHIDRHTHPRMHAYTHIHKKDHARAHKDTTPHTARTADGAVDPFDECRHSGVHARLICAYFSSKAGDALQHPRPTTISATHERTSRVPLKYGNIRTSRTYRPYRAYRTSYVISVS